MPNKYDTKIENCWNESKQCHCNGGDCRPSNHRLCYICNKTILYGAHESVESQTNSAFRWNIDHVTPKSRGGSNSIDNLRCVHVICNQQKDCK